MVDSNRDEESEKVSALELGSEISDPLEELEENDTGFEPIAKDENETLALDKVRRAVRNYGEEEGITTS